jgi:hypothetical protein
MPRITSPVSISDKFRELVVYIAEKSADDPRFGAVKLNKILYYSDFDAYRLLGHSISGDEYQNLAEGPAPKHLVGARDSLLGDHSVSVEIRPYFNKQQMRLTPNRPPKPGVLSEAEIEIVDEVITALWPYDGKGVTDRSHEEFGWKATQRNEIIPYFSAWVSAEPLTAEQIDKAFEVAERHGLSTPPRS